VSERGATPARLLLPWLPSLAYMGVIWALSSQSKPFDLPDLPFRDKIAHGLEYGILAVLNLRALRRSLAQRLLWSVVITVLITSAWGYLDEIHQAFVPGRNSDVYDWFADTGGAIVFASVAAIASHMRSISRAPHARS
jgi:VanZ family protein